MAIAMSMRFVWKEAKEVDSVLAVSSMVREMIKEAVQKAVKS